VEFLKTNFNGLWVIRNFAAEDSRGNFIKVFRDDLFKQIGIEFQVKESFFSISKKGVVRGLHFQSPPHEHAKLIFCPAGAIWDVALDLRKNSETFGKLFSIELNDKNNKAVFVPPGFAHGFQALENNSITFYLVTKENYSQADTGLHPLKSGFSWPLPVTLISERDERWPPFTPTFHTPFS